MLSCACLQVSGDKYQRIIGELTRELDAEENSAIPKCELDVSSIEIGELKFYERKEVQIKIRNVGSSMATFRFVPKFGEALFSKRWIMVASDSVGGLLKVCQVRMLIQKRRLPKQKCVHSLYSTQRHLDLNRIGNCLA